MKILLRNMILLSVLVTLGCNIDIENETNTIEGSWASRDNFYDGCYALYSFSQVNDQGSGVYKSIKSKELHGVIQEEQTGTYSVDFESNTILLVNTNEQINSLGFSLEKNKLYLEGDALHSLWKSSKIELLKI